MAGPRPTFSTFLKEIKKHTDKALSARARSATVTGGPRTRCVEIALVGVRPVDYKIESSSKQFYTVVLETFPCNFRAAIEFGENARQIKPVQLPDGTDKLKVSVFIRRGALFGLCEVSDVGRRAAEARGYLWLRLHDTDKSSIVGEVLTSIRYACGPEEQLALIREKLAQVGNLSIFR